MSEFRIVSVDSGNVDELGFFCVGSRKHPGYVAKRAWLDQRFREGLRIRLAVAADGAQAGFVEYAPGEATWRVVEAPGYLVIHCFWVKSAKYPGAGLAAALLEACFRDAESGGLHGLAVVSSDGTWMADRRVYLRHGFEMADEAPPHYQLLARRAAGGPMPAFPGNWQERLGDDSRLRLFYTDQCPYIGKIVPELPAIAAQHGIRLHLVEMRDPAKARATMPSPYGVFGLVHGGRLLADHPISATRFRNILRKDLGLQPATGG